MIRKLAIAVGGFAAAGVVAVALGAAGFGPGTAAKAADYAAVQATDAPAPKVETVTDTVYIKPTPKARVIHIKKPAVASKKRPAPVVTIVRRAPSGGERDSENDNGDD